MKRMDRKFALPLRRALELAAADGPKYFEKLKADGPSLVILSCSCSRGSWRLADGSVWPVSVYGGAVAMAAPSLDVALRQHGIPALLIVGHSGCEAVHGALGDLDRAEPAVLPSLAAIAPAFAEGRSRALRGNVLRHIDHQVGEALARYGDLVKESKLSVVGALLEEEGGGRLCFVNYNGLKGRDKLAECLAGLAGETDVAEFCL